MSTISASTTTTTAYKVTADTTGALVLQTGATPTTAVTIGSDQSVTFAGAVSLSGNQTTTGNLTVNGNTTLGDASTDTILMTGAPSIGGAGLGMGMGFRNRIINGAMVIDQRNAGASVTPTNGQYTVDRWLSTLSVASKFSLQQNAGSVTPPAGFINYLGATSLSAYSVGATETFALGQPIEGLNVADLSWGTASAATVTLSFWVRSSLTGTFGGSLRNSAVDRSYPFSYTISAANTWEQKSITIAGDTSGTWLTTNGLGIQLLIGLGSGSTRSGTAGAWAAANYTNATGATSVVGTNGATFYITGVQLEKGSTATSFDYRPYGTELLLCQRYFETLTSVGGSSVYVNFLNGGANATTQARFVYNYQVQKRSYPSVTFTTASGFSTQTGADALTTCTALVSEHLGINSCQVTTTVASGLTAGATSRLIANGVNTAVISCSAEL